MHGAGKQSAVLGNNLNYVVQTPEVGSGGFIQLLQGRERNEGGAFCWRTAFTEVGVKMPSLL